MTGHGCGGTRSCSSERISVYAAGRRSGRVEANWAALIKGPPNAAAASSTRPAPRRCCNSQSSTPTRFGTHRARSRNAAYPSHRSAATAPSTEARGAHPNAARFTDLGGVPPAEAARPKRSPAPRPADAQRNAWARVRSPMRPRNAALAVPSEAKTSHVSSPERRVARVIISSAARVSLSQTPAASAKLWNKFFAMSAYKRAIPLRSISISSVEAKHAMLLHGPQILRRSHRPSRNFVTGLRLRASASGNVAESRFLNWIPRHKEVKSMTLAQDVRRLKERLEGHPGPVLSVYLSVNARYRENQGQAYKVRLKDALEEMEVPGELAGRVRESVEEEVHPGARTLIFFAAEDGLFERYGLQVDLPEAYRFGEPYLAPLVLALDEHEAYGVALFDAERFRFFVSAPMEEPAGGSHGATSGFFKEVDLRPSRPYPRGGMDYEPTSRRTEANVHKWYNELGQLTRQLAFQDGVRHLILAGPKERTADFRDRLPQEIKDRVVAEEHIPSEAPEKEFFDRLEGIHEW